MVAAIFAGAAATHDVGAEVATNALDNDLPSESVP